MSIGHIHDLPDAVAGGKYCLALPGRGAVTIALTLKDAESVAATVAREQGAVAYGLVSVSAGPCAADPLVWLFDGRQVDLAVGDGNALPDDELLGVIGRCLQQFFADLEPVSPQAAALKFCKTPAANDNTVH